MVHYLRGKGLDHGVEPSIVKYVKYSPPPPTKKKKKKKKKKNLGGCFQGQSKENRRHLYKGRKKRYNLQGKRDHYAVFFKKFVQVQRVKKLSEIWGLCNVRKFYPSIQATEKDHLRVQRKSLLQLVIRAS